MLNFVLVRSVQVIKPLRLVYLAGMSLRNFEKENVIITVMELFPSKRQVLNFC